MNLFFVVFFGLLHVQGAISLAAAPPESSSKAQPAKTTSSTKPVKTGSSTPVKTGSSTPVKTGSSTPVKTGSSTKPNSSIPSPTPTGFWPTAVLPKFPRQFGDLPSSVLSCWNAWGNYELRTQVPNPGIIVNDTTSVWWSPLPTPITDIEDNSYCDTVIREFPVSLTTLCDGFPRASYMSRSTSWTLQPWIINITETDTLTQTVIPGTTISGYENSAPDCLIAPNSVPLCDEVNDAYTWWLSSQPSKTPAPNAASTTPTPIKSTIETLAPPDCIQFVSVPPNVKPTCSMDIDAAEIWYWPAPGPTGSDFCNSSWVAPTGTPTISGKPNTAVISGITMTSPSIYQIITSATLWTLAGTRRKADDGAVNQKSVFSASTVITPGSKPLLTDKRLESDIISWTLYGPAHPHGSVTYLYNHDFRINDIFTMRSGPYFDNKSHRGSSTIIQAEIEHSLGVPVSEFAERNKVFKGCVWTTNGKAIATPTDGPVVVGYAVPGTNFRPIVTGGKTVLPPPVTSTDGPTPRPPLCKL